MVHRVVGFSDRDRVDRLELEERSVVVVHLERGADCLQPIVLGVVVVFCPSGVALYASAIAVPAACPQAQAH